MKKNNFNIELLNEELKRFKLLETYDFYTENKSEPEYKDELDESEEIPDDLQPTDVEGNGNVDPNAGNEIANELGVDFEIENNELPTDNSSEIEEPESIDDSIEIDVTSLVKGSEEAKKAANRAFDNSEMLLDKLSDLEKRISRMDSISTKIEDLEKEIVKRNPTPVEKLEMRSLNSFPYSQKLTDYWKDKDGAYNVMGDENKKEEYILTKDDVNYDYSEPNIKRSFSSISNDYEEEDI